MGWLACCMPAYRLCPSASQRSSNQTGMSLLALLATNSVQQTSLHVMQHSTQTTNSRMFVLSMTPKETLDASHIYHGLCVVYLTHLDGQGNFSWVGGVKGKGLHCHNAVTIWAALPLLHAGLLTIRESVASLHLLDKGLNLCCCLQNHQTCVVQLVCQNR